jgi:hypothetical protein
MFSEIEEQMKLSELLTELITVVENVGGDHEVEIHDGGAISGVTWNGETKTVQLDNECYYDCSH